MYEQYTDKQIVEMLVPKLNKAVPELNWDEYLKRPDDFTVWTRLLSVIYKSGYIRGQLGRSFIIGEKALDKTESKSKPDPCFKVGDKVKFIGFDFNDEEALSNRRFYPPVGTIGQITETGGVDYCFVQWPYGITSGNGVWACRNKYLKKIKERWVPTTETNLKPGVKVRYLSAEKHEQNPEFYPSQGTIGEVVSVSNDDTCRIQWPGYTTSWFASRFDLEVLLCE